MITSCCSNGSTVTVTETATNTVLVVDGVATLIPKYKNCDGADLDAGAELATCQDLTDAIGGIPTVPYATSTVPGIVTLALASEYPSASTTEATTPAFVNAAVAAGIAAIPAVPTATDTVEGKVSLAVSANYPSTSNTEAATPAFVNAAVAAAVGAITGDDDVTAASLTIVSNNLRVTVTEGTTVVVGDIPLSDIVNAILASSSLMNTLASGLISANVGNSLRLGTDGLLFENDAI